MSRAWVILVAAGLLEIVWSVALKQADGLTRLVPTVIGIAVAAVSLGMLSIALADLPVGTAYAVWVGIGTVGVAVTGMALFGEAMSLSRLGFLLLIVAGIIGLKLVEA
ncbi:quaternary ammonium compound-resistance protein SugE [Herbihabitans rhizosphaerae]|uniref:Quaternary ammonium compound-resistance protein SugE n=1 Tax=Herbihabitans rhizosphaerae TaxID=1872711 RepID=A0A4Q7KK71_9PSEU|nr:SMR family transporter [Herbihabitans rhizosphaerae]RZS36855.1 quaternary ammonium compound-resistance protein SugE [Herbihabitans rhizosphaerae]